MLCSKCYQEISQGKEIQIKGSIICKECALLVEKIIKREVAATCNRCHEPVYRGDVVWKITYSKGISWLIFTSENIEEILCFLCYNEKKWTTSLKNIKKAFFEYLK